MSPAIALAVSLLLVSEASAYSEGAICDAAALLAAETHGVPPQIMLAITRVESGRQEDGELRPWPWAVNQAGASHWFDNAAEAESFVRGAIDAGQANIDIGCFQLNLRWHGEQFSSLRDMFDPEENADYAARFLVENHTLKGNWVDAVAAYHSQTQVHAEAYIERVEDVLIGLNANEAGLTAAANSRRPKRENGFPLLQPGSTNTLASLVPSFQAAVPLFASAP